MLTCKDWGRKLGRGAPQPHHHLNLWIQVEEDHLLQQDPPRGGGYKRGRCRSDSFRRHSFLSCTYFSKLIAPYMTRVLLRLPSNIMYSLHRFSACKDDSVTEQTAGQ